MPFELLKGIGKDYAYNPMEHGFSQREIKDTIRRMEYLMKDLDALIIRKEKEMKKLSGFSFTGSNYIGRDMKKVRHDEAYDAACWMAMDKVGIEFELPVIEEALKTAPEETPPLRHEDYLERCKKLQARRGEYWRINPTFMDSFGDDRRAGIGLRTPEKEKYWPTHQVPWEQGAPSPPPALESPEKYRPWETPPAIDISPPDSPVYRLPKRVPPPPPPDSTSSESSADIDWSELEPGPEIHSYESDQSEPLFTPPKSDAKGADKDLQELSEIVDEVDAIAVQLMKVKSLAHFTDSPQAAEIADQGMESPESSLMESPENSPFQIITQEEFDSIDPEYFLAPEIYPPDIHEYKQPGQEDDCESPGILEEGRVATEAFSPEQLCVDEMEIMMQDAVQRQYASEQIDPCEILDEAFSPEVLDDNTLQRMLQEPRGPTTLLSHSAHQGLKLMATEPTDIDTASRYGYMREERWKERLGRWNECEERQREEQTMQGQVAQARQMDAAAVFGVRSRGITPPPAKTTVMCPRPSPETLPWGESPVDHISPPAPRMRWQRPKPPIPGKSLPRHMWNQLVYRPVYQRPKIPKKRVVGKGKRLVHPKPSYPPRPLCEDTPPSRLLYPETKGGPTVSQPDRPSTSQTIYNTRRRQYEHLDPWVRYPNYFGGADEKSFWFSTHKENYEKRLQPGPGIIPPKPTTPPPPPPLEYGPDPEHLSVYVPESVEESPDTFKQRIIEAIDRFEKKMVQVRQRLERKTFYRSPSRWVQEEYTSDMRKESEREKEQEKMIREEMERRKKWDTFMLCKFGAVPSADRYGRMRGIRSRTASTFRPRPQYSPPRKKKTPVNKPYDEPLYGPWLPWVYGSNRPPPRTAAGRISSPCEPSPKPAVKRCIETPSPQPCSQPRTLTRQIQPAQVQYGSARAPPKTAASYKYQKTPVAQPACANRALRPRKLLPSTPEMLYGSVRTPPRTAACASPQIRRPPPQC